MTLINMNSSHFSATPYCLTCTRNISPDGNCSATCTYTQRSGGICVTCPNQIPYVRIPLLTCSVLCETIHVSPPIARG